MFDAATGNTMWELAANVRSIPKPVAYGVVPAGITELHAAEPLRIGTTYSAYVAVLVGPDTLGGIGQFTP